MPIESEPRASSPAAVRGGVAPLVLAALVGIAVGDCSRPPARQMGASLAVAAIDGYRATLSRVIARTGLVRCRFHPTCSAYGREAIVRYGLPRGAFLAAARVLRCNPLSKGGEDPVP